MTEVERKRCNRCKVNLTMDKFKKKRDDTYQKICNECLSKQLLSAQANKCVHGKQQSMCKECGGCSICEHSKRRSQCKECGGGSVCEHGRRKDICKECSGSQICEHSKRRSQCKECGGGSVCEHGRRKSSCKCDT